MPAWLKIAATAVLLVSIAFAFFGPRPARPAARRVVAGVGLGGLGAYALGLHAAVSGETAAAATLIAVAVESMCLAVWLARSPRDDGGEPRDDPTPGPGVPPSGLDWDDFDRARQEWSRPRTPA